MLLFRLVQDVCTDHADELGSANVVSFLNLLGNTQHLAMERSIAGASDKEPALGQVGAHQYLQMIYAESAEASRSELSFMFRYQSQGPQNLNNP